MQSLTPITTLIRVQELLRASRLASSPAQVSKITDEVVAITSPQRRGLTSSGVLASSKGSFGNLAALSGRGDGRFNRGVSEANLGVSLDESPPFIYSCIVEPKTSCATHFVNDVHEVTEVG